MYTVTVHAQCTLQYIHLAAAFMRKKATYSSAFNLNSRNRDCPVVQGTAENVFNSSFKKM